jgi:hypothetical protein
LIQHIPPEGLSRNWDFYKAGIEDIISYGAVRFRPEDVYARIYTKQAFLYRVGNEGFFVVEKCLEHCTDEPFMNVWLMWFKPGAGKAVGPEVLDYLDRMAESAGCKWINFGTARRGWAKALGGRFKEHLVILRRDVGQA